MPMRAFYRSVIALTTVGVLSICDIGTASATGKASVYDRTGRESARVNYWSGSDVFRVSDTRCDAMGAYAQYQRAGAQMQTLRNKGGCRTHTDFQRYFTAGQTIKYRVCVASSVHGPFCSAWKWDTTSG